MTKTKTKTKTKTMVKTNTFREHLQRATLEICDLWYIWSGWWGHMTWPKKRDNDKDKYNTKTKTKTKTKTFREHLQRAILETCVLWQIWSGWQGDMTRPKKKTITKTKTKTKTKTLTKTNTFREHLQRAIPETCDLWDISLEWWVDMTWPKKRQWQRQRQRQRQWQRQIHSESSTKERS